MIIASKNKYLYTLNNANRMAESTDRAFLTAEEVVGLLDSDEDEYLRSAGLEDIFPGSDDELGFEEEELDNGSDSEGEAEQETEL